MENGGRILVRNPQDALVGLGHQVRWLLDPVSFNPGVFTINPILFRIPPNFCSDIQYTYLKFVCSETGGVNPMTPVLTPYLIDRIEIGVNGDPTPLQTLSADWLYSKW